MTPRIAGDSPGKKYLDSELEDPGELAPLTKVSAPYVRQD